MSIKNNRHILLGSILKSFKKRLIRGDNVDNSQLVFLNILIDNIEYCTKQYNQVTTSKRPTLVDYCGNTKEDLSNSLYPEKIKKLNLLLQTLKYQCDDICEYKDRVILKNFFTTGIKDNTVNLPLLKLSSYLSLKYYDIIHGYSDSFGNSLKEFEVTELSLKDLKFYTSVNNVRTLAVVNTKLSTINLGFSVAGAVTILGTKNIYVKNLDTLVNNKLVCKPKIYYLAVPALGADNYTTYIPNLDKIKGNLVPFEKIVNQTPELPENVIHLLNVEPGNFNTGTYLTDVVKQMNSFSTAALDKLKERVTAWHNALKASSTKYSNSKLITYSSNDLDLLPSYKTKYSTVLNHERILPINLIIGLLAYAKSEGKSAFNSIDDLISWIKDRNLSIVLLTFDNLSHRDAGKSTIIHKTFSTASKSYIDIYNDYMKLRPALRFFKGFLAPIYNINDDNQYPNPISLYFQLVGKTHKPTELTSTSELGKHLGSAQTAKIIASNKFNFLTTLNNPYRNIKGLVESGWDGMLNQQGDLLTLISSSGTGIDKNDYYNMLVNMLKGTFATTGSATIQGSSTIDQIKKLSITSTTKDLSDNNFIKIKVKNNNDEEPLKIDTATIKFNFPCITVPDNSNSVRLLKVASKGNNIVLSPSYVTADLFDGEPTIPLTKLLPDNKLIMKIVNIQDSKGFLYSKGLFVTNNSLPLIVTNENLKSFRYVYNHKYRKEVITDITKLDYMDVTFSYKDLNNFDKGIQRVYFQNSAVTYNKKPSISIENQTLNGKNTTEIQPKIITDNPIYNIYWSMATVKEGIQNIFSSGTTEKLNNIISRTAISSKNEPLKLSDLKIPEDYVIKVDLYVDNSYDYVDSDTCVVSVIK